MGRVVQLRTEPLFKLALSLPPVICPRSTRGRRTTIKIAWPPAVCVSHVRTMLPRCSLRACLHIKRSNSSIMRSTCIPGLCPHDQLRLCVTRGTAFSSLDYNCHPTIHSRHAQLEAPKLGDNPHPVSQICYPTISVAVAGTQPSRCRMPNLTNEGIISS